MERVPRKLNDADYARLLEFRTGLRRFLRWSEDQAAAVGLTPAHHQLLLAIRGHRNPRDPTIGDIAETLLVHHHSAVELIDRAAAAGLVERQGDPDDHRVVRVALTPLGAQRLGRLSALHLQELTRFGTNLRAVWTDLQEPGTDAR